MNPWFLWKGKNSLTDFGLWISKLPKRVRPEERHEEVEIPGRAGSLLMLEGKDVYSSYNDEMIVVGRNSLNFHEIAKWLRGKGEIVLSTDTEKALVVSIVGEIAFERVGNSLMQATIPMFCEPYRINRWMAKDRVTFSAPGTIRNPGDLDAKPIVTISGSGECRIGIGGTYMTFHDLSGQIVVDCGAQIVTQNSQIWQGSYTGDFWQIPVGESPIDINVATVTIDPHWRWF